MWGTRIGALRIRDSAWSKALYEGPVWSFVYWSISQLLIVTNSLQRVTFLITYIGVAIYGLTCGNAI
jgi:hypothetical protein